MLQIFEKIKPLDSAPTSLSVTTAALSSTRAGRFAACTLSTFIFTCLLKPSPSPSSMATRRQHHPFCYSRSKLFNTASTRERAKFLMDMPQAARLFDDEERAVPVAASSQAVRQRRDMKQRMLQI